MIDLHNHLLPGLDDGSPDFATSIEMARMAEQDGITHIACTPHANHRFSYDPFRAEDLLTELRSRLVGQRVSIELIRAADFHLSYENIQEAIADPARFSIGGRGYVMAELPDHGSFGNFSETFYQLQVAGLTPVLTHPERNPTLQEDGSWIDEWLRQGVLMQVTANSLTGGMGKKAQKMALDLLDRGRVHIVATDAHNLTSRPPRLQAAYDEVARRASAADAERLFRTNPLCAIEGRPLGAQPAAKDLYDDGEAVAGSWWQRLLRR